MLWGGEDSVRGNDTTMLRGWTRTNSRKSPWKAIHPDQDHSEDHLKDGEIVENLSLKKRHRGSVRINRSTDLQELEEEEEEQTQVFNVSKNYKILI